MSAIGPDSSFHFVSNNLALDFTGSVSWRGSRAPVERFADFAAVVSWARQSRLIDPTMENRLSDAAAADPKMALRAHRRALRLRDLLYRVFADIADGDAPAERDLGEVNRLLRASFGRLGLTGRGPPYRLDWQFTPDCLEPVLGPVLKAAAELLSSTELAKLRKCSSPICGWLFIDTSRTGRRRWCAMWACGNRAKAKRFYQRHAS